MDYREQILALAQHKPVFPNDVAKHLQKDSIIAAAMLSEMVSKGQLKITHIKIGSSPLYYAPGNEAQLQEYTRSLSAKEQTLYKELKQEKVLRENEQTPLTKHLLKNLKDFAKPLEVTYKGKKELFYKWYLTADNDAQKLIGTTLHAEEEPLPTQKTIPLPITPRRTLIRKRKHLLPRRSTLTTETITPPKKKSTKKKTKKITLTKETLPKPVPTSQETLTAPEDNDHFLKEVITHFQAQGISIANANIEKKNSKATLELLVPSPVGELTYYCVADKKKRVNDKDLSGAFLKAQLEKLPLIYLSTGQLTKKAEELLIQLKGVTFTPF